MRIDFDHPELAIPDCPKCRFSMTTLEKANRIRTNEGYSLTDDDRSTMFLPLMKLGLIVHLLRQLFSEVLKPLAQRSIGRKRQGRYDRILTQYPNSIICTHCKHLIRRK